MNEESERLRAALTEACDLIERLARREPDDERCVVCRESLRTHPTARCRTLMHGKLPELRAIAEEGIVAPQLPQDDRMPNVSRNAEDAVLAYEAFLAGHARPVANDAVDGAFDRWWTSRSTRGTRPVRATAMGDNQSRLVRVVTLPHEGMIICADHLRQVAPDDDPSIEKLPADQVKFWGYRCLMCGVDPSPGRTCSNEACNRPLHPQWPAVYCCNDCALEDV